MKKDPTKVTRRGLLQAGAGLALQGVLAESLPAAAHGSRLSVYEAIGVPHVINATGTVTNLGGSVMPPEVVGAWVDASRHFVNLLTLQDKVGERIARLIGVEAAMVTTGAAGALLLGTAAVVTGSDRGRIRRLPDTTGMKNEVILQKTHHSCYDNQLTDVGVRLIEVETSAQVERAVNARTALMFFMNVAEGGRIDCAEWLALARHHKIPTLLDAAADVPPLERLSGYNRMGFDLVAISGGKALRGPNDTGLLLGQRRLIAAAKLNANPHCGTIGRMMKSEQGGHGGLPGSRRALRQARSRGPVARLGAADRRDRSRARRFADSGNRASCPTHCQPCAALAAELGREALEGDPRPTDAGPS
jgi:D-glucosaminate-6-phosphate ammonia-lyase